MLEEILKQTFEDRAKQLVNFTRNLPTRQKIKIKIKIRDFLHEYDKMIRDLPVYIKETHFRTFEYCNDKPMIMTLEQVYESINVA